MSRLGWLLTAVLLGIWGHAARAQTNPCAAGYIVCGMDYSANKPAVPLSGYVLIATVPASARSSVAVQNQSTDLVQVVRDDGLGNNVTTLFLAPATSSPGQGGAWSSTFKGRVRVYAPSGADVVAVSQD